MAYKEPVLSGVQESGAPSASSDVRLALGQGAGPPTSRVSNTSDAKVATEEPQLIVNIKAVRFFQNHDKLIVNISYR